MGDLTKNFSRREFACHCGCGFDDIDLRLVDILQTLRDYAGVPLHVNSGCRCTEYNKKVGGVDKSWHTKGKAADISASISAKTLFENVKKLHEAGKIPELKYCIYYSKKNFIHIDVGKVRNHLYEVR